MTRRAYAAAGGFDPASPLLEDVGLVRRLHRLGPPGLPSSLELGAGASPLVASGRRWDELGVIRTLLVNQAILLVRGPAGCARGARGAPKPFRGVCSQ